MLKKDKRKVQGMNLSNQASNKDAESKNERSFSDFVNKKTVTIAMMGALILGGGVFITTNVEANDAVRTTFNEVSVSVMKTRHSSGFEGKEALESNESVQKESDQALDEITATWTDNTVDEIKAEIERQREDGLKAYIVQWGDTLSVLAEALGVSEDYLVELNNISDRHLILTGDILDGVLSNNISNPAKETDTISETDYDDLVAQEDIDQKVAEIDTNSDGVVSVAEANAAGISLPIDKDHWLYPYMTDVDNDGSVGESDALVELDTDKNGYVSDKELDEAGVDVKDPDNDSSWMDGILEENKPAKEESTDNKSDENVDDDGSNADVDDGNGDGTYNPDSDVNDEEPDYEFDDVVDDAPNKNDGEKPSTPDKEDKPNKDDTDDTTKPDEPGDNDSDGDVNDGPVIDSDNTDKDDSVNDDDFVVVEPGKDDGSDDKPDPVVVIGESEIKSYENIAFETITEEDDSLYPKEGYVKTSGMVGEVVITIKVTNYSDGTVDEKELSREVTRKPVNQIEVVGTKDWVEPDNKDEWTEYIEPRFDSTPFVVKVTVDKSAKEGTLKEHNLSETQDGYMYYWVKTFTDGNGDPAREDERLNDYKPTQEDMKKLSESQLADVRERIDLKATVSPDMVYKIMEKYPHNDIYVDGELVDENYGSDKEPQPDFDPDDKQFDYVMNEDGKEFKYDHRERVEVSRVPIVSSLEAAQAIDPTVSAGDLGSSDKFHFIGEYGVPILANETINPTERDRLFDADVYKETYGEDFDTSPLDIDERRYSVKPEKHEAEWVTDNMVYYFEDEEVYRESLDGVPEGQMVTPRYFIGKSKTFMADYYK